MSPSLYYESEFEEKLIELIRLNYGLKNNEIVYFIMRYMIVFKIYNFKDIDIDSFIEFLLTDNNLPKKLIYKKTYINLYILKNIVNNWFLDLYKENSNTFNISFIEKAIQNILSESISNNTKFKKESFYNDAICLDSLINLNKQFLVFYEDFYRMDDLEYDESHNDFERFRENKLELNLKAFKEFSINPFSIISENDVEKYLKKNLNLIEEGLKLIDTQYKIEDGVIDILAEDKNNKKVIIELKIKSNDTRIVWQAIYYPLKVKEIFKIDDVRMILICPKLNESIYKVIETLSNIEYFEYELKLKDKKIDSLILNKIK